LLLIHQIPPEPAYARVKVRRRLVKIGAVALKNTVYVLPNTDEAYEDFEWLARDIAAEGGDAVVCAASFLRGISDEEVEAMFARERDGAQQAAAAMAPDRVEPGRTWVTRSGIRVDRMASAWLIRRFIDPEARFKFVPARGYRPEPGELRFDMYDADYTHEGPRCTFETLVARFDLEDPALRELGEIVHDVDCKDDRFGRAEAAGVAALVDGLAAAHPDDGGRLEHASAVFEGLYRSFARRRR
jgi:hypothetical protein